MRTSLLLGLGLLIAFRANADEISREPAMESIGPTVIGESIDDQAEDLLKGPIDLQFSYIADFGRNLMGGARVDNAFMGLAALRANFDLNKALGWNGGSVFLHLQSVQGTGLSPLTSDMQIQSNIEANAYGGKIYEAWFKQELFNGKASVLAGLYDFNSEFYLTQSSVVFLNSSFGVGGEISQMDAASRVLSTFPTTSPTLRLRIEPIETIYLQGASFFPCRAPILPMPAT